MSSILSSSELLSQLESQNRLKIFPEDNYHNSLLFDKPLVILIHGLGRTMADMTDPMSAGVMPFDIDYSPGSRNLGDYPVPPAPILEDMPNLMSDFFSNPSIETAAQILLGMDLELSPELAGDLSWFSYLKNRNYPVLTYSMSGADLPLDSPGGVFEEFLRVMEAVHSELLVNNNGGDAGCKRLALIGHSRGGLVARRYIAYALSGLLGPKHEEIVVRRVRFLGTLNSPHLGSNLAMIPDVVQGLAMSTTQIPVVSDLLGNAIHDFITDSIGFNPDSVDELSPLNSMIVSLNVQDELVLNSNRLSDRIRRASTGSNAPVIRRLFGFIYDPESYIPDPGWMLLGTPVFTHTQSAIEAPLSPILEDVNSLSIWETSGASVLLAGALSLLDEVRAEGPDLIAPTRAFLGGDLLVNRLSAILPRGVHQQYSHHHGAPLWHPSYKSFITALIPPSICFPPLNFLLGDNVVEISWNPRPDPFNPYKVWRFDGNLPHFLGDADSGLYYDSIWINTDLKYLVTYPGRDGVFIEPDYFEADYAGRLQPSIRQVRLGAGIDAGLRALPWRAAVAPVAGSQIVFLAGQDKLLSERLNDELTPLRNRIIAFKDGRRVSIPYCMHERGNNCVVTWLTFGFPCISTSIPVTGTPSSGGVASNSGVPGSSGATISIPDYDHIVFSLYAGLSDANGSIPEPVELVQGIVGTNNNLRNIGMSDGITFASPRYVLFDNGRAFAFTMGSHFHVVWSDFVKGKSGRFRGTESSPNIGKGIWHAQTPLGSSSDTLVVFDMFVWDKARWIALVGAYGATSIWVIVGTLTKIIDKKLMSLPGEVNSCLGAVFSDDPTQLHFYPGFSNQSPTYGSLGLDPSTGHIVGNPVYSNYTLPELPSTVAITYQDVARRCGTWVDLFASAPGYFNNNDISSTLCRIRFSMSGPYSSQVQHHSAYGNYAVSVSHSLQENLPAVCLWQPFYPSSSGPFDAGLYGQRTGILPACKSRLRPIIPDDPLIPYIPVELLEILRKLAERIPGIDPPSWIDPLVEYLGKGRIKVLVSNPSLRNQILALIQALRELSLTDHSQKTTMNAMIEGAEMLARNFLDVLDLQNYAGGKPPSNLIIALKWVSPHERNRSKLALLSRISSKAK